MTTIACDRKHIAGDGLVTGDGMIHCDDFPKVVRLDDGRVAGFTGTIWVQNEAVDFLNGKCTSIDLGDNFEALILGADGVCRSMEGKGRIAIVPTPAVAGSGGAYALAAMKLGKGPLEAVCLASDLDTGTGGQIVSMTPDGASIGG